MRNLDRESITGKIIGSAGLVLATGLASVVTCRLLLLGVRRGEPETPGDAEKLRLSESEFRAVFEHTAAGLAVLDVEGKFIESNPALRQMLGYGAEDLHGVLLTAFAHPEDEVDELMIPGRLAESGRYHYQAEKRYVRKDGEVFWAQVTVSLLREPGGEPNSAVLVVEDVNRRKLAEEALKESERRFRQLFENSTDSLFVHDQQGRLVDCNAQACKTLGYTREELLALSVGDITIALLTEEDKQAREGDTLWERVLAAEPGAFVGFERNGLRRKNGSIFPVEVGVGAIDYKGRRLIFAAARDITERQNLENRLSHQAFHDFLTGLPNRALFMDRLQHALARREPQESYIAVLFLDIDDFKNINDTYGHEIGDHVLTEIGRRLVSCVRAGDTVARLAGDEFTLLLEDVKDKQEAALVAERIEEKIREPLGIDGHDLFITASIGVMFGAAGGGGPGETVHDADSAMYEAKRKGKDRYEFYGPQLAPRSG